MTAVFARYRPQVESCWGSAMTAIKVQIPPDRLPTHSDDVYFDRRRQSN